MSNNDCEGCEIYTDEFERCKINKISPEKCPCGSCLLKMSCSISCNEWNRLAKQVEEYLFSQENKKA